MKKSRLLGAVCACLLAVSFNASAITIDFEQGAAIGGTLTSLGGGDAKGEDIVMTVLKVDTAPANNGIFAVQNGLLNFNTVQNTIALTGRVDGLGLAQQTLLSGTFNDFNYSEGTFDVFSGGGQDVKSCNLLTALAIDCSTPFEFFTFELQTNKDKIVSSADIINTALPVPAAVWLFGSGLLGLIGMARRKAA